MGNNTVLFCWVFFWVSYGLRKFYIFNVFINCNYFCDAYLIQNLGIGRPWSWWLCPFDLVLPILGRPLDSCPSHARPCLLLLTQISSRFFSPGPVPLRGKGIKKPKCREEDIFLGRGNVASRPCSEQSWERFWNHDLMYFLVTFSIQFFFPSLQRLLCTCISFLLHLKSDS